MGSSHGERRLEDINEQQVENFYEWLQGAHHPNCLAKSFKSPKLTSKMAFRIIYYLQEVLEVLPDSFERCKKCKCLYDSYNEGATKDFYCDCCRKAGGK